MLKYAVGIASFAALAFMLLAPAHARGDRYCNRAPGMTCGSTAPAATQSTKVRAPKKKLRVQ